jgi:hypothetical protein
MVEEVGTGVLLKHGFGYVYWPKERIQFRGEFKHGNPIKNGKFYYPESMINIKPGKLKELMKSLRNNT